MNEHAIGIGKAAVVYLSNLRRKAAITTSVTSQDPHFRVVWMPSGVLDRCVAGVAAPSPVQTRRRPPTRAPGRDVAVIRVCAAVAAATCSDGSDRR